MENSREKSPASRDLRDKPAQGRKARWNSKEAAQIRKPTVSSSPLG